MAVSSRTASFVRFYVSIPDESVWSEFDERLKANAFKPIEGDQLKSSGFVSWDNGLVAEFPYANYKKGEYIAFQFRIDEKKVPYSVKVKDLAERITKFTEENRRKPNKSERADIKMASETYLYSRAFAQPTFCDVVWNTSTGMMYVGSTSNKVLEAFVEAFEYAFAVYPEPLYNAKVAEMLIEADSDQYLNLTNIIDFASSELTEEGRPLASDFLGWLWYKNDTNQAVSEYDGKTVKWFLGDRMTLTLSSDPKERVVVTGAEPGRTREAISALIDGKFVSELAIGLQVGSEEFTMLIDTSLWSFRSFKAPKQDNNDAEEDPDGLFLEKMYLLEQACNAFNGIVKQYLDVRLDTDSYIELSQDMSTWRSSLQQ